MENSPEKRLDRSRWHRPLVSVIVTHHNYSDHVEDALLSLLDQTHENWQCVVVDDASTPEHLQRLRSIVAEIGSPKIKIRELVKNVGQTRAFFAGADMTDGEFVSLLDPDDRYAAEFLADAVAAHLNSTVMCPVLSTDQYLVKNGEVISGVNSHHRLSCARWAGKGMIVDELGAPSLFYVPENAAGWHWTSSSSLVFRRSALAYLTPTAEDSNEAVRNSVDSYVAQGLHRLGGTLFLAKPLVYRTLHERNDYISDQLFASGQKQANPRAVDASRLQLVRAIEAIKANGGDAYLVKLAQRRTTLARWRRSIDKRWKRLQARWENRHARRIA
jgi:glycosyltransferase involved in cell wall biosynthesis